ncbi:MAG: GTPase [Actinomycetota bacterium]
MRSGFATLIGRPNVGKSTLLNRILGTKVSIVSDKPQTTRSQVRGVLHRPDAQVVFVDTPGIHKPRSPLGSRLNDSARDAAGDVDVVCLVLDATQPFGRGDEFVATPLPRTALVIVNKADIASQQQMLEMLTAAGELGFDEYFPVSAVTGKGVDVLVEAIVGRMPEGPAYYPDDMVTDVPEAFWVAELVREQLFRLLREELPHSLATRVTEWEWPRIRVEILVERDSQKGIVIGHQGSRLKEVGTLVREQLPEGAFVELFVCVDRDWHRKADQLGY